MLKNLTLKGFKWRREPALYLTLIAALSMLGVDVLNADVAAGTAVEMATTMIAGFFIRGKVSPAR